MKSWRCTCGILSAFLAASGGASATSEETQTVKCFLPNQSVQAAVDKATPGIRTTIFITGECVEDVTIDKDAITLNGDPNHLGIRGGEGTINGQITVTGADNISIEFLTMTGPGDGILITDGADADISHSIAKNNDSSGIAVSNTGAVKITATDITNNGQYGVVLNRNASVELRCENVIAGAGTAVIWLEENSTLRQTTCGPIIGPPGNTDDVITALGPGGADPEVPAIVVFNGSTADLNGADVTGRTTVYGTATFRVQTSEINGNVEAIANSLVGFTDDTSFTGTLTCDDTSGIFGELFGLDAVTC